MSRRIVRVEDGVLRVEQRVRARREIGTDLSGPCCVYAAIRVHRGTVAYLSGNARTEVPDRCELFLPPFAIAQTVLERCDVTTTAVAFRPPPDLPSVPLLLPAAGEPPRSRRDVLERLRAANGGRCIPRAPDPPRLAARAKAIIDAAYATPLPIGGVAARLRTSPALLSRVFKGTYGLPPVRYRHHVRVMDALLRFAEGAAPAAVFQDVGFDDLSRFYHVFRKVACAAPGSYRPARSKSAKT